MSEVEKSGKEQMNWVKDKDAQWWLEIPSWEQTRWASSLSMLGEKPLSESEKLRLKALGLSLQQRGRLSASQLARLRVLADKYKATLPTVPSLPVALGSSDEETKEVTKEEGEEPNKEELWKEFSSIVSKEGQMTPEEELRSAFEEEWNLSLRELPPEQAQKMVAVFAHEVITKGVPLPPKLRPPPLAVPVHAGPLDLLVRDFLEGKIDYETYQRRARELEESRRVGKGRD